MLAKVRSAVGAYSSVNNNNQKSSRNDAQIGLVIDVTESDIFGSLLPAIVRSQKLRYPYTRPEFLHFSDEEISLSADQSTRPVLCPKDPSKMPVYAGYAEVINAGKTVQNEDQASAKLLNLIQQGYDAEEAHDLTINNQRTESEKCSLSSTGQTLNDSARNINMAKRYEDDNLITLSERYISSIDGHAIEKAEATFFAIFDGHAGSGAAVMSSNCLHEHIRNRLCQVLEAVFHLKRQEAFFGYSIQSPCSYALLSAYGPSYSNCNITCDSLIVGAIETAFIDMDDQIAEEKQLWRIRGGCTAIAALFFLGKIYVANAGDCRALLITTNDTQQLSHDFTPGTERKRLQFLAYTNPNLISNCFTRYEYNRFLTRNDLRRKVLYRDWFMDGWAAKTVRESDLKMPLISECGKKRRLLNTIGVSRGFGDHHLFTADNKIPIKPFLSPVPEIKVLDLRKLSSLCDNDVLVLASDGLWDALDNDDVSMIVKTALNNSKSTDYLKYTIAAQELAVAARGNPTESYRWQMSDGGYASTDDITVFIVPLKHALEMRSADDNDLELFQ
ncbi:Protein phosphatase 2C family protein [Acanthocheilonema viteae]